jgi:hypothetical protein
MSTIGNTITHGVTLANTGTYTSPLTITATGYIENTGTGDAIFGPNSQAWTVVNYGRVAVNLGTFGQGGIDLKDGGLVANSGTITAPGFGVLIAGAAGTVTNSGTIKSGDRSGVYLSVGGSVNNAGGLIQGYYGVAITGGAGTVSNSAEIAATGREGVSLGLGGYLDNTSTGTIVAADAAVVASEAAATVINSGTIIGAIVLYRGR